MNAIDVYDMQAHDLAPRYDAVDMSGVHGMLQAYIRRQHRQGRAIDVGAGSGRDARWLAGLGCRVTAVEPARGLRDIGSAHPDNGTIEWIDDRLPDLPGVREDGSMFEVVLCCAVMQHLDEGERARAFRTLAAITAPSGVLAIMLRHGPAPDDRPMHKVEAGEFSPLREGSGLGPMVVVPIPDQMGRTDVRWELVVLKKDKVRGPSRWRKRQSQDDGAENVHDHA